MLNKLFKKIVTFVLVVTVIISVSSFSNIHVSSAENTDVYKQAEFSIKENLNLETSIMLNGKAAANNKGFRNEKIDSRSEISLILKRSDEIKHEDYTPYQADGSIVINGKKSQFSVSGQLFNEKTDNGDLILLGTLDGYLNNIVTDENYITLSVHYVPGKNLCFIPVTIGIADNDGNLPISLDYGTPYNEITNPLFKKQKILKERELDEESTASKNSSDSLILTPYEYGGTPTDFDPRLKNTSASGNGSMSVSVYFQNKAVQQTNNLVYAKLSANETNWYNYCKNNIDGQIYADGASRVDKAWISMISADPGYSALRGNCVPASGATTISFNMPVYFPLLSWQILGISFNTSTTNLTFRPCTGGTLDNICDWEFWRLASLDPYIFSTSSTPESDDTGLGVRTTYSYLYGVSSNKNISLGATGKVRFTYTVKIGSSYSERDYTMSTTAASSITITP